MLKRLRAHVGSALQRIGDRFAAAQVSSADELQKNTLPGETRDKSLKVPAATAYSENLGAVNETARK